MQSVDGTTARVSVSVGADQGPPVLSELDTWVQPRDDSLDIGGYATDDSEVKEVVISEHGRQLARFSTSDPDAFNTFERFDRTVHVNTSEDHTFEVTAIDGAGNSTTRTVSMTGIYWGTRGQGLGLSVRRSAPGRVAIVGERCKSGVL